MRPIIRTVVAGSATAALTVVGLASPALASHSDTPPANPGSAGEGSITVPINDSTAGGTYYQPFDLAYSGETPTGTPVYVYVPKGALDDPDPVGVHSLDPAFDHNETDEFVPCADAAATDFAITKQQVTYLGDTLANQIVAVDEAHFGETGDAGASDDALVTLVYNVQDDAYYNCAEDSYTAGYFAPEYIDESGMNVIVLDALDWANRVGEDPSSAPWGDGDASNDRPELYEGVIAHELEHLLMNYSDPGELSWVDEGLADMAAFLNGFDMTGSHLTYQQVFHRETSLTRWGGGLENYGASFSYFAYLWEQAGGNGGGSLDPNDLDYDNVAGDRLIKLIFEEQADGMEGVQNAINTYNATNGSAPDLLSAAELFQDWAVTMYLDDEGSNTFDLKNFDLGLASGGWTIDVANDEFWDDRGNYRGRQPEAKWDRQANRPDSNALPFGVSYEKFRNPGPKVGIEFTGEPTSGVTPPGGGDQFWGGYTSQSDTILDVTSALPVGGKTLTFSNYHFIEEGWDYGFVEAFVNGEWKTVEVKDANGAVVTTNDDPHGGNTEGNGITGTSGGAYFVDEPEYVTYSAALPADATDVRFRYSTDAAYLDTGWFIDEASIGGTPVALVPAAEDGWVVTDGQQDNNWTLQVISTCDLTPGAKTAGETIDTAGGNWIYRFTGDRISTSTLTTKCANGNQADFVVSVSNLPTGDLEVLDATYDYSVVKRNK
jgi:hypothetical protein